jgi:AcrR family transcriptional regulator
MANAGYLAGPERRKQILDAAKKVFAARGYHDTNISHICDDLGIARGTLYQYFDSKKAVFSAIVEDLLARVRKAVAEAPALEIPAGFRPSREQVIRYSAKNLQRMLDAIFEDEASLRILVREAVGLDVQIDGILRAIDAIVIGSCATHFEIAQRAGILRSDFDPQKAALFVLGGVEKLAIAALEEEKGRIDLALLSEQVTRMHMQGLLSDEVR